MIRLLCIALILLPKPSQMLHTARTEVKQCMALPLPFEWVEMDSSGLYHVHLGQEGLLTDDLNNLK